MENGVKKQEKGKKKIRWRRFWNPINTHFTCWQHEQKANAKAMNQTPFAPAGRAVRRYLLFNVEEGRGVRNSLDVKAMWSLSLSTSSAPVYGLVYDL